VSNEPVKRITVRQANALATSAQQMELNEKRLILIAMSRIGQQDKELLKHQIPITELQKWFGGDVYKAAKRAATGLLDRKIYIESEDGSWLNFQWTTLARYIPAHKQPDGVACIEIKLNEELKPWLLQLKERYNSAPLSMLLPIPSLNSERLYEILWHHSHAGDKHFLTYDILKLKVMLGLADKEGKAEKYKSWRDFKYVLDRAQEDFKEYTNLRFNYQGIRHGRSYKQVRFVLTLNQPEALAEPHNVSSPLDPEKELAVRQLAKDLEAAGYLQDPYEAVEAYGLEDVRDTLKLARDAERKAATSHRPIYNLGGLVTHMLKSGVASRRRATRTQESRPLALTTTDIRRIAETLVTAFSNHRAEQSRLLWDQLSQEEQETIVDIMRVELDSTTLRILDKGDWQGPSFESIRNAFLYESRRDQFPQQARDVAYFVSQEGLLSEFGEQDRNKIISEAESLL
jgi:hypothetical protein